MKKLRYAYSAGGLNVLVPKQRGEGYLKQPYGHHNNPQLNEILDAASPYALNLFGLDGYLHFEVRLFSGDESRVKDIVIPLLEKHYGFESEEISHAELCDISGGQPATTLEKGLL